MMIVAFVLLAGLAVGAIADHQSLVVAVSGVFVGAMVAALLDVTGLLWRAWRTVWAGRPVEHSVRDHSSAGQRVEILSRALWLMMCDTFALSTVLIALVGGLTYMILVMLAWSGHLVLN
jgi:hypothetical protein